MKYISTTIEIAYPHTSVTTHYNKRLAIANNRIRKLGFGVKIHSCLKATKEKYCKKVKRTFEMGR